MKMDNIDLCLIKYKADAGDDSAQWQYAMELNREQPRDVGEILHYLSESAKQGNKYGQYFLAYFLAFGDGCRRDHELAATLCECAQINGHEPAGRLQKEIQRYTKLLEKHDESVKYPYRILYEAWYCHDVEILQPLLAEDIIFVNVLQKPIMGKDAVIADLRERFLKDETSGIEVNYYPSERYGNIIEFCVPNKKRCILIAKTNNEGKIDRIAIQPIVWANVFDALFSSCVNSILDIEIMKPYETEKDNGYHYGHMFCMSCGRLSHQLAWARLKSKPIDPKQKIYEGRVSICPHCKQIVEFVLEDYREQPIADVSTIRQKLKECIKDNIKISGPADFNVEDASFITNIFRHISIEEGKILGMYRHGYGNGTRDFYSSPYIHDIDAFMEFKPEVIRKEIRHEIPQQGFLRKLLFPPKERIQVEYISKGEYSPRMVISRILEDVATESIPLPSKHVTLNWCEEAIWEVFWLDNLKFLLPSMGHANYMYRKFLCSPSDIEELPDGVVRAIKEFRIDTSPKIQMLGSTAIIECHYFNEWEGLIKWTLKYEAVDENLQKAKIKFIEEKQTTIIPYASDKRY